MDGMEYGFEKPLNNEEKTIEETHIKNDITPPKNQLYKSIG